MTTIKEILAEFDREFIVRNYEVDAHATDVHITDRPEEIKSFISSTHSHLIEEIIKEVEIIVREEMDKTELQTNAEFIACDDLAIKIIKRLSNLSTLIEKK